MGELDFLDGEGYETHSSQIKEQEQRHKEESDLCAGDIESHV